MYDKVKWNQPQSFCCIVNKIQLANLPIWIGISICIHDAVFPKLAHIYRRVVWIRNSVHSSNLLFKVLKNVFLIYQYQFLFWVRTGRYKNQTTSSTSDSEFNYLFRCLLPSVSSFLVDDGVGLVVGCSTLSML